MRINTVGTPIVTAPEPGLAVEGVRALRPVEASGGGAQEMPVPRAPMPLPGAVEQLPTAVDERRRQARRSGERRQQQVAVLIDTRVSERRALRRREQDATPPGIDVEA